MKQTFKPCCATNGKVINSRITEPFCKYRRHECRKCKTRWTTYQHPLGVSVTQKHGKVINSLMNIIRGMPRDKRKALLELIK